MKLTSFLYIATWAFTLGPVAPGWAQLTPDSSLGAESSVVTPVNQTTDRIEGGAVRGSNLFHSFGEFNVDAGRSVYFANPPAIENILTRVTGGNQSNIFGTLGVLGEANLYLINPGGIVFGRSARLDIGGSFFATTGEGIQLGENGLFSAKDLDPSSLLHVRPEALFHNALANQMAKLNNQGNLAVGRGSSLVLHGGEVSNSGSLAAPGGTVMVLGERISLLDDARIDVSSPTGGGRVFIGGFLGGLGNIPTAGRTYIGPDVTISADALNTGDGGNVYVWASDVTGFYGDIRARGGLDGGDGGFVEVSGARRLIFRGEVDTTAALGNPGTLLLDPRNIIIANGEPSIEVEDAEGTPFDMFDSTEEVTLYESQLEGLSGDANLVLQATNDIKLADLEDNSLSLAGGTGDITFIADADRDGAGDFSMADPADTINTNGRNIAITGASLTLGNIDTSLPAPDGAGELLTTAAVVSTGPGEPLLNISGNLFDSEDVDLYQIYLTGEGSFSATTIDGSNVDTQLFLFDADGLGVYGNDDSSECNCFQSTLPAGDPLTPTAPGIYYLGINVYGVNPVSESGEIFADSQGGNLLEPTGAGGALPLVGWENVRGDDRGDYTITLTGVEGPSAAFAEVIDNTVLSNNGAIALRATNGNITAGDLNAASFSGAGGEIRLDAAADIVLDGSRVDASGVVGGGGDITLNSGGSISLNNGFLSSNTNGRGDAGKVTIAADDSVRFSGGGALSQVNSSGVGDGGGIEITTGTLDVTDGAQLGGRTFGEGNAGNISITATESVLFSGMSAQGVSGAFSLVEPDAVGDGGGIEITTGTLDVTDGAQLSAITFGEGAAGNISITATESVLFSGGSAQRISGAFSSVQPSAVGDGGGIEITTGTLDVTDGARLSASTLGEGNAGNISITATERVLFSGTTQGLSSGALSFVAPYAVGDGGGIEITTGTLDVTDGAQLSADTLGAGSAGNIRITAAERVLFSGSDSQGIFSGAFSAVAPFVVGDAGGIEITTGTLDVTDGAQLGANTFGEGSAGTISITATERVLFSGESPRSISGAFSTVELDAVGDAGGIEITTGTLDVTDGAQLNASTFGEGDAGTIRITATGRVLFSGESPQGNPSGAFSLVERDGVGDAGGIEITTGTLDVTDGALLSASTRGVGDAGTISITATERVLFSGESSQGLGSIAFSTVQPDAVGDAGGIEMTTGTIDMTDGAQLDGSTFGEGEPENIRIAATERVLFSGEATQGLVSGAFSAVAPDAVGSAGGIEITTGTLDLTDGVVVSAGTFGEGDAGTLTITASEAINISGLGSIGNSSGLFADTVSEAVGETGDIIISTQELNLGEAGVINAITRNDSRGGDIQINTNRLAVTGGAQILSSSFTSGDAGTISIDATEGVMISGIDPTYNSRVAELSGDVDTTGQESAILSNALSTGTGGTVTLRTDQLQVSSGAQVSVSSEAGKAGSLNLRADAIELNNGTLSAETAEANQGSIAIDAQTVVLRNNSAITTNAIGGATGGNITISTDNLVAMDDSDITASAIDRSGGNISITTSGLFLDNESEITATGEDLRVIQREQPLGIVSLAETLVDPERLISKGCQEYRGSEFIITGRGGIPPHPLERLRSEVIWLDWRALTDENSSLGYSVPDETSPVSEVVTPQEDDEIRQAQGWLQLPDGTVVLTAYPVNMTPVGPVMQHPGCQIILGDS